ncbi:MAG TPA: RNA polymerase sigma-70 factor [Cyclobacteriaceae bacterium]
MLDDKVLAQQIRDGDANAFEKIFNSHYGMLCLFARKMTGDMDQSRDIVQEVFVTLYAHRNDFQINTSLKSYLFKCVYNSCLNKIKQQKIHKTHHEYLQQQSPIVDVQDLMIQAELEEKIRIAVDGLPEQCRKIFTMNRYGGKKNAEIAEELGISIRTVETQISKALTILRLNLSEFLPTLIMAVALA